MDRALDLAYAVAVACTLWSTGIAVGMKHGFREAVAPLRRGALLGRMIVVDAIALPVIVWALVSAAGSSRDFRIGLLLVGIASAGPLGIKAVQIARGDVPLSVSLVVTLELANLVAIPVWVLLLMPDGVSLSLLEVLRTLLLMVLLPLAAGIALRAFGDGVAKRWAPRAAFVSSAGLTAVVVLVLLRDGSSIADGLGDGVPLVAAIAVGAALGLGWLAGGPAREARVSTALVTGIRANGPALAIAAASFSGSPDVRVAVVTFAIISALGSLALAVVLARGAAGAHAAERVPAG